MKVTRRDLVQAPAPDIDGSALMSLFSWTWEAMRAASGQASIARWIRREEWSIRWPTWRQCNGTVHFHVADVAQVCVGAQHVPGHNVCGSGHASLYMCGKIRMCIAKCMSVRRYFPEC